jgi:NAD(P)-dependent dehydrogenase (short-subunit alcohol dehydrogenase family)
MGFGFIKMEKNKLIIILGSSGGIGTPILKYFSKKYKILAIYKKNRPIVTNKGIKYLKLDLVKKIKINKSYYKNKKIIYINLAAIKNDKLLINYKKSEWRMAFKINVESTFEILKIILPEMILNKWGRIINFSSTDGINGDVGISSYSATKYSLHGLSRTLSKEYGMLGITSNVLVLGNFNYGMFKKLKDEKQKRILERVPNKKTGNIKNIINAINFLISSDYVNGAEIKIDGGM